MARVVRIDSLKSPLDIPELRSQSGWGKRLSLYSAVRVKEVKACFLHHLLPSIIPADGSIKMRLVSYAKKHKVMYAVIIDFDHSSELA